MGDDGKLNGNETGTHKSSVNEEREVKKEKKRGLKFVLTIVMTSIVVVTLIAAAVYFIHFKTTIDRAVVIISDNEITDETDSQKHLYPVGSRIYFSIKRSHESLNANLVVIDIEIFRKSDYRHYKQISYEIERDFKKISTYIPEEYFNKPGKYRIKVYLDGKIISTKEITVGK